MSKTTMMVTLTAASMGDVDEADYSCWIDFVSERIDEVSGCVVALDHHRLGSPDAGDRDEVSGGTAEQRETVRLWLAVDGWEAFCGEEWEARRRAYDAEQAA